jgi:hypothetical protein
MPFDPPRHEPLALQRLVDLIGDRLCLARIAPGADHEMIRVADHVAHVEDDDVAGKLLGRQRRDAVGELGGVCQARIPIATRSA